MISRKEIVNRLISDSLQMACRDVIDGSIDLETFHRELEQEFEELADAGYRYPAIAAYVMEYGFFKIDQGQEAIKDRLEDILSVIIKSARSRDLLGMMMDMPVSGMRGMEKDQAIPLKEYASPMGFAPLNDVSVLKSDNPFVSIPGGREHSWQKSLSDQFASLVPSLIEGKLFLPDFRDCAVKTTGDTGYGYADAIFMTMSKGFEYFATRVEQNDTDNLAKKRGVLKAAISTIILAADTDMKQKQVIDELINNGAPEEIQHAYDKNHWELSAEKGYEAIRRPEKVKEMFASPTAMRLYGNEEGKKITLVEYAQMMTRHPTALVAEIAKDVLSALKQHDLSL